MNTLVSYDSSSDEESTLVQQAKASAVDKTTNGKAAQDIISLKSKDENTAPLLGPSVAPHDTKHYYDYDEEDVTSNPASERGMIRFLTQPLYPMTEMPRSPPGSPDIPATDKLKQFLHMKMNGAHFNEDLAQKTAFRNPSVLQTLMDRVGLNADDALKTSLPLAVFDSTAFPASGYKEGLLKNQQTIRAKNDAEKKKLAAAGKRTIDFASGSVSSPSTTNSTPTSSHQHRRK